MTRHTATAAAGGRLDAVLAEALPEHSRSRLAALVKAGHVQVDGVVATRPATRVPAGAVLHVDLPPPEPDEAVPQDLPISVVYEDEDIVVVDKRPGMVVHPGAGHADGTLVNALLHHVGDLSGIGGVERPGIVHRLDRGTSGLVVVAKHDRAHRHLAAQFADKTAGRRYLALVLGRPRADEGCIESHLARHPRDRLRWASTDPDRGKIAITWWRVLDRGVGASLLECRLGTGRTHQVRVHLSEAGWPLLGDAVYGPKRTRLPARLAAVVDDERPLLHAWRLELAHPRTGERQVFFAAPPADLVAAVQAAGISSNVLPVDAASLPWGPA